MITVLRQLSTVEQKQRNMYGIFTYMYHQNQPNVEVNIPIPWIFWELKSLQMTPGALCQGQGKRENFGVSEWPAGFFSQWVFKPQKCSEGYCRGFPVYLREKKSVWWIIDYCGIWSDWMGDVQLVTRVYHVILLRCWGLHYSTSLGVLKDDAFIYI